MIISQTPLRVSLSGGGTDFYDYYIHHEGFVVSTAIDKYVFVVVKERFDDLIYVSYTKKEIVENINEIQHDLVREAAKRTGMDKGFEVSMMADIPSEGSGLGSSSSLTVGLLNGFYQYNGVQVTAEDLAQQAYEIEVGILKRPIGKQDQYIAAYGGLSSFKFKKDDTVLVEKLKVGNDVKRRLGENLLLFYTNINRLSSTILTEQKENIGHKREHLGKIKHLAHEVHDCILKGTLDCVGETLDRNWIYKKQLSSNISNPVIEEMHETAMKNGAIGAKISGAGGGGFLLVYCPREKQDRLHRAMKKYREMPFMLEPQGSRIIFNYRRYDWK
ncbi:MAG: GHMP kinase [Candidatus Edwardsbacteria bacterium RIFOXYD12_FULL_50_11]|uniref:GHMP kinase n=1 Tax=Candidatus Edwardsbacteria bacterium GWF2_54_11 TaxID=1817851 RepID=A0A1F5R159_9BACT|nr:MAG: GHMP kinase [Candidatus Edwardsbacteria bacterium RifOxyC12_full_54_24]OGF07877.1 MAG: GHMP kinase [Candidatus Edwardsbacteria bacterium RifOxyA12_full_54_48]OGF08149.1 MAG: GHMP kinase [Candidatus Edwardsbacteria bacterium GWF2_54_11]OGF10126.1 MAG: GHMP kinase [Candidatus Edwardsbacteria bacterium GWE2_54_12]OGF15037.1 MAG: GHMP kinase [Candidatus Edwardsbacteria bacterium RIFOXYD12_FULL_50_11]OGJ19183.1 MAG: GHMP kinase [Candidatus Edwardsbacteria bacterium RifOxyB12_full_52_30]HAD